MQDAELEDLQVLLPALLQSLDGLTLIARFLDPDRFPAVMEAVGEPDAVLHAVRGRLAAWPDRLAEVRDRLATAADEAVAAFVEVRTAAAQGLDLRAVYRALRHAPRAQEALYPLCALLPPVSRFFLDPAARGDAGLLARLAAAGPSEATGVFQIANEPGMRGGFSLYVPEYYAPDRDWPLVVALHGGGGAGRGFLWSWLAAARARGAILAAPTALGETWALMGEDIDTPNLVRIHDQIAAAWRIDATRCLLTGMSDGGTFTLLSGLAADAPFTHLAPVAASFHPLLLSMAEPERLHGLPVYLVHGALDWMFPVQMGREARQALAMAGAEVVFREIADLSHTYPRDENGAILDWLMG